MLGDDNLKKHFGLSKAVDYVNLDIAEGEIFLSSARTEPGKRLWSIYQ